MTQAALDDNLVPGQTYTFVFKLGNLITLPDAAAIQNDLQQYGPSYMGSLGVSQSSGFGLFTNYYNATFTYQGDGSDVISDVGSELASAVQQGSNDSLVFQYANIGVGGASATAELGSAVQSTVQAAAPALPSTTTIVALVIGLGLVVFIMSGGPGIVRGAATA